MPTAEGGELDVLEYQFMSPHGELCLEVMIDDGGGQFDKWIKAQQDAVAEIRGANSGKGKLIVPQVVPPPDIIGGNN